MVGSNKGQSSQKETNEDRREWNRVHWIWLSSLFLHWRVQNVQKTDLKTIEKLFQLTFRSGKWRIQKCKANLSDFAKIVIEL